MPISHLPIPNLSNYEILNKNYKKIPNFPLESFNLGARYLLQDFVLLLSKKFFPTLIFSDSITKIEVCEEISKIFDENRKFFMGSQMSTLIDCKTVIPNPVLVINPIKKKKYSNFERLVPTFKRLLYWAAHFYFPEIFNSQNLLGTPSVFKINSITFSILSEYQREIFFFTGVETMLSSTQQFFNDWNKEVRLTTPNYVEAEVPHVPDSMDIPHYSEQSVEERRRREILYVSIFVSLYLIILNYIKKKK